jgi:5-methylcytosine-specific restriction endonuclease McrA
MRTVPEWIGKTDDSPVPARVMVRVFDHCGGNCVRCGRRIGGNVAPAYDHIIAITNGGANRESNLQLLCNVCHGDKTKVDMRVKSKLVRTRLKHLGIKRRKGRGFRGWRRFDGTVVKK